MIDIVIFQLHTKAMMQPKSDKRVYLLVDITEAEKEKAKRQAKSEGCSLQGWIGRLVKNALKNNPKEAS